MDANDSDDRLEALQDHAADHGFHQLLEYSIQDAGDDWVRASVPHFDEFVNPPTEQVMHGGISASVLDATMGYAVMSALYDEPDRTIGPTLNLNINYVATADEPLEIRGSVVRMGRHVAFLEGAVEGAETDKLIATGQGIWLIFHD